MNLIIELKAYILQAIRDNTLRNNLQVYAFTNENISGYLNKCKLKKEDKVLSICSSGDHLYNLLSLGINNIDLIDINPLTEYYTLGLKKALLKAYNYKEIKYILNFLYKDKNLNIIKEKELLYSLLNYMDTEYKEFWLEIFNYYFELQDKYKVDIKLLQILCQDYYFKWDELVFNNNYLKNNDNYQKLQNNLQNKKIYFETANIFNFNTSQSYDLILCSNALEHCYYPNLTIDGLNRLYKGLKDILKEDSILLATYIYGFKNVNSYSSYPIGGTDITYRDLIKEEILEVDSYKMGEKDALLVLRK
ncbi:MAG: DUF3419 family protein [Firmicutes bacterium]|nr:DUF3419 family protein [Bacillota bacterium]